MIKEWIITCPACKYTIDHNTSKLSEPGEMHFFELPMLAEQVVHISNENSVNGQVGIYKKHANVYGCPKCLTCFLHKITSCLSSLQP